MTNFTNMTTQDYYTTNGGGPILAGCAIVGGCIVIFAGAFGIGYGLAKWLG